MAPLAAALTFGLVGLAPAQAAPAVPGTVGVLTTSFNPGGTWSYTGLKDTPDGAATIGELQWLRDGDDIAGATGQTYVATSADLGYSITLEVEVSAPGYADTFLESTDFGPIEAPGSSSTGGTGVDDDDELDYFDAYKPLITGKARVGQTVQVETDPDDYDETTTLVYQWMLGGKPAKKGTGTSFKLKKKHRGLALSVQVTASAPGYETETVTSRAKKVKR